MRSLGRHLVHAVTQGRRRNRRWFEAAARDVTGAHVLEIGSGRPVDGGFPYSFADVFDPSCEVVRSDLDPSFGHRVIDVTAMDLDQEFDVVLCANVLEHVPSPAAAVDGIHAALKPGGLALVSVPMMYPLHDEPHDYWRITEHGLRHLFREYRDVSVAHGGMRVAPFGYFVRARKA